jgi:tetratricopeptide (TPR) repeat protein
MTFSEFLNTGWNDHAKDPVGVAARMPQGLSIVETTNDIPALVNLAVHVFGEHLGKWQEGTAFLEQVATHSLCASGTEACRATLRGKGILAICRGDEQAAEQFAVAAHFGDAPINSTKARIHASAAAALAGQKQIEAAQKYLDIALELASYGPGKDDPVTRALAVTGNNLAAGLEDQPTRTPAEVELMKRAARIGRQYWEIAGSWVEVERAEYRLAMTMLAAGDPVEALQHADTCLNICHENKAEPMELFFAHEARAKCLWAAKRPAYAEQARNDAKRIIDSMRQSLDYMTETLNNLDKFLR